MCFFPIDLYINIYYGPYINPKKGGIMPTARCMRCRKQVEIKNPQEVVLKNNLRSIRGVCPNCGTKVSRILGKAK